MKSVNLGFAAALLVLFVSFAAQAQSPVAPTPPTATTVSAAITAANAGLADAEKALAQAKVAYAAGVASQASVLDAENALDQARVQQAIAQNQNPNFGVVIKDCIEQLAIVQQQYRAGVASQSDVLAAQLALEKAQSRADLYKTVITEKEMLGLINRLNQVGAAPQAELEKAQAELKKAQDAFQAAQP